MTVVTVSRWWCTGCDAGDATQPGADQPTRNKLDKAAERHTKTTGHTTHSGQTPDPTPRRAGSGRPGATSERLGVPL